MSLRAINTTALITIKAYRHQLTEQQYEALRGQVLAGDDAAAMADLKKLLRN